MKKHTFRWLNAPQTLHSGECISCEIDGILLEGIVEYDIKDISVKMSKPIYGPFLRSHIWSLAPYIYTTEPIPGCFLNAVGLEKAKDMLLTLYSKIS